MRHSVGWISDKFMKQITRRNNPAAMVYTRAYTGPYEGRGMIIHEKRPYWTLETMSKTGTILKGTMNCEALS